MSFPNFPFKMPSKEERRRILARIEYDMLLEEYERERVRRREELAPIVWRHKGHTVRLELTEEWYAANPPEIRGGGLWSPFLDPQQEPNFESHLKNTSGSFRVKDRMQTEYSWAVPTPPALDVLAFHAPIVEIGAGTGYWAYLLRQAGVDIKAFDIDPPSKDSEANHWHRNVDQWTEVEVGGVDKAGLYPERALFLCWPIYDAPVGAQAITAHLDAGGKAVVFVGEGHGGCTGDAHMFSLLDTFYDVATEVSIPQWWGLHDFMTVYHRNDVDLRELPSWFCHKCGRRTWDPYDLERGKCSYEYTHEDAPELELGGVKMPRIGIRPPVKALPKGDG